MRNLIYPAFHSITLLLCGAIQLALLAKFFVG